MEWIVFLLPSLTPVQKVETFQHRQGPLSCSWDTRTGAPEMHRTGRRMVDVSPEKLDQNCTSDRLPQNLLLGGFLRDPFDDYLDRMHHRHFLSASLLHLVLYPC